MRKPAGIGGVGGGDAGVMFLEDCGDNDDVME